MNFKELKKKHPLKSSNITNTKPAKQGKKIDAYELNDLNVRILEKTNRNKIERMKSCEEAHEHSLM